METKNKNTKNNLSNARTLAPFREGREHGDLTMSTGKKVTLADFDEAVMGDLVRAREKRAWIWALCFDGEAQVALSRQARPGLNSPIWQRCRHEVGSMLFAELKNCREMTTDALVGVAEALDREIAELETTEPGKHDIASGTA